MKKHKKIIGTIGLAMILLIVMTCTAFAASSKATMVPGEKNKSSETVSGQASHAYGYNNTSSTSDMTLRWYYSYGDGWNLWKTLKITPGTSSTTVRSTTTRHTLWYINLRSNGNVTGHGYVYDY